MAALDPRARAHLLHRLSEKYGRGWKPIEAEILRGFADIDSTGYCVAYWAPGMTAISTPLAAPNGRAYALSVSYHSMDTPKTSETKYGRMLVALRAEILETWRAMEGLAAP
jgi:DNA-binding IclR family transcriptional regulator